MEKKSPKVKKPAKKIEKEPKLKPARPITGMPVVEDPQKPVLFDSNEGHKSSENLPVENDELKTPARHKLTDGYPDVSNVLEGYKLTSGYIPYADPPHFEEGDRSRFVPKAELDELISRFDQLSRQYEEEKEKRKPECEKKLTNIKVLCSLMVSKIEENAWKYRTISLIGEDLYNEIKEFCEN